MTRLPATMALTAMQRANALRREDFKVLEQRRTAAWQAHTASIEAGITIPTIQVPYGPVQFRVRGRCPYCAGSVFRHDLPLIDVDRPHVASRGALICVLCSRTCAHLEIGVARRREVAS